MKIFILFCTLTFAACSFDGYNYVKPDREFILPSEINIGSKSIVQKPLNNEYLPPVQKPRPTTPKLQSTTPLKEIYLPPASSDRVVQSTIQPQTPNIRQTTGYDYPIGQPAFNLPTEIKQNVEYLPPKATEQNIQIHRRPTTPRPTTPRPTTQKPTTHKITSERSTTPKQTTIYLPPSPPGHGYDYPVGQPAFHLPATVKPRVEYLPPKSTEQVVHITQKPTIPKFTTQRQITRKPTIQRVTTQKPTTRKPTTNVYLPPSQSGYQYPVGRREFNLPTTVKPRIDYIPPKETKQVTIIQIKPKPSTKRPTTAKTTTPRPTTQRTTTRRPTTSVYLPPSQPTSGYQYPVGQPAFNLPTTTKPKVDYLPPRPSEQVFGSRVPLEPSRARPTTTRATTRRPTTPRPTAQQTTTRQPTTNVYIPPTQSTSGYQYPVGQPAFNLPTTTKPKVDYLPPRPSGQVFVSRVPLEPSRPRPTTTRATTRRPTTPRPTTQRTTTRRPTTNVYIPPPQPTSGYQYPVGQPAFNLPTTTKPKVDYLPPRPSEQVSVSRVPLEPSRPRPTTTRATTRRPTTPRPTTQQTTTHRPTTNVYLPPSQPTSGYKYPVGRPAFNLPTTVKPRIDYIPPKETKQVTIIQIKPKPSTKRPTTAKPTAPRPTTQRTTTLQPTTNVYLPPSQPTSGYQYPVGQPAFNLPTTTKPKVDYLPPRPSEQVSVSRVPLEPSRPRPTTPRPTTRRTTTRRPTTNVYLPPSQPTSGYQYPVGQPAFNLPTTTKPKVDYLPPRPSEQVSVSRIPLEPSRPRPTTTRATTRKPTTPRPTTPRPTTPRPTTQRTTTRRPTTNVYLPPSQPTSGYQYPVGQPAFNLPTNTKPKVDYLPPRPSEQVSVNRIPLEPSRPRPTTQRLTTRRPTTNVYIPPSQTASGYQYPVGQPATTTTKPKVDYLPPKPLERSKPKPTTPRPTTTSKPTVNNIYIPPTTIGYNYPPGNPVFNLPTTISKPVVDYLPPRSSEQTSVDRVPFEIRKPTFLNSYVPPKVKTRPTIPKSAYIPPSKSNNDYDYTPGRPQNLLPAVSRNQGEYEARKTIESIPLLHINQKAVTTAPNNIYEYPAGEREYTLSQSNEIGIKPEVIYSSPKSVIFFDPPLPTPTIPHLEYISPSTNSPLQVSNEARPFSRPETNNNGYSYPQPEKSFVLPNEIQTSFSNDIQIKPKILDTESDSILIYPSGNYREERLFFDPPLPRLKHPIEELYGNDS